MMKGMQEMNKNDVLFFYKLALEELVKETDDIDLLDLVYRILVEAKM